MQCVWLPFLPYKCTHVHCSSNPRWRTPFLLHQWQSPYSALSWLGASQKVCIVQPFDLCEFAIPTDFHVSVDSVEHRLGIIWFLAFLLVEIKLIFRKRIGTTYHAGKKIDFRKLPELLPAPFMIHFTMRLHTRVVFHIMNCDSLSTTRANRMGFRNGVSRLTKHTGLLVTVLEILEYFNILIELSPVCCKSHSTSTFEFYVSKQDELVQHILRICFVEDLPVFDHLA